MPLPRRTPSLTGTSVGRPSLPRRRRGALRGLPTREVRISGGLRRGADHDSQSVDRPP